MHKLLARQLKRCLDDTPIEALPIGVQNLIHMIDRAYQQADEDRELTERSLELTSGELVARNRQLGRLAAFPERNPNPVIELKADHTVAYINPAGTKLFPDLKKRGKLHPLLANAPLDVLGAKVSDKEVVSLMHQTVVNGKVYSLDVIALKVLKSIHVYVRDITDQNKTQLELEVAHEELKQSHTELQQTQMQLIQAAKLESLGRLAAGVAHEVKNPLSIMRLGVDYLLNNIKNEDPEIGRVLLDMKESIGRADNVIYGLLDFSAQRELKSEPQSLRALLEESLNFVKHEFSKANIKVTSEIPDELPQVVVDKQKIEQVFVNLFINAVHAMGHDGGQLKVRAYFKEAYELDMIERKAFSAKCVIAEISDTGPGFAEVERVFEPFYTTKSEGKGTGLGMSTVKKILELHGAEIQVRNLPTQGAQVKIFFPVPEVTEGSGGK